MEKTEIYTLNSGIQTKYLVSPATGRISPAIQCPSPNQDDRPRGAEPQLIVLHGISLPPGKFGGSEIESLFTNCLDWNAHPYYKEMEGLRVSAHLLIRRHGQVIQFVPLNRRAWHAGTSSFRGREFCNDFAIGIELEGTDDMAYTDEQYATLTLVVDAILNAYPETSVRKIAGHCDVSLGRKTDPGPAFDWLRLYDGLKALIKAPTKK